MLKITNEVFGIDQDNLIAGVFPKREVSIIAAPVHTHPELLALQIMADLSIGYKRLSNNKKMDGPAKGFYVGNICEHWYSCCDEKCYADGFDTDNLVIASAEACKEEDINIDILTSKGRDFFIYAVARISPKIIFYNGSDVFTQKKMTLKKIRKVGKYLNNLAREFDCAVVLIFNISDNFYDENDEYKNDPFIITLREFSSQFFTTKVVYSLHADENHHCIDIALRSINNQTMPTELIYKLNTNECDTPIVTYWDKSESVQNDEHDDHYDYFDDYDEHIRFYDEYDHCYDEYNEHDRCYD